MLKKLVSLGLSESQAKVYFYLLKRGKQTASLIAKDNNINRSVVYSILEKLKEMGLTSVIIIDGKRYFSAANPKLLKDFLDDKQEILKSILPKLTNLEEEKTNDFSVEVFQGVKGGVSVLKDILRVGKDYISFGYDGSLEKLSETLVEQYTRQIVEKNIKERIIANEGAIIKGNLKNSKIRYLSKNFKYPTTTTIYGNNIVITTFQKPIYSILIRSEILAKTYKNLFEFLWKIAKP